MLRAWILLPISILLIHIDEPKLWQLEYRMRILYYFSQRLTERRL